MEFVVRLYRKQVEAGRVFIHENLAHAKSWALPMIRRMMSEIGVDVVEADQCMFGLKTWGPSRHQLVPARKPTKFITNTRAVAAEQKIKCDKSHDHQPLVDGRAKGAARYPPALCRGICRGVKMPRYYKASALAYCRSSPCIIMSSLQLRLLVIIWIQLAHLQAAGLSLLLLFVLWCIRPDLHINARYAS